MEMPCDHCVCAAAASGRRRCLTAGVPLQAVCLLFGAQFCLVEGSRVAAAQGIAAAEAAVAALPEQQSAAVSQLRLHALVLTTLRQLAAGDTGEIVRSGAGDTDPWPQL